MGIVSEFDFSKKDNYKNSYGTIYAFKEGKIDYIFSGLEGGDSYDRLFLITSYSNKWQIRVYRRDEDNGPFTFQSLQEIEFDSSDPYLILNFTHYSFAKFFDNWSCRSYNYVYEYGDDDALSALHIYERLSSSDEIPEIVNKAPYILNQSFILK